MVQYHTVDAWTAVAEQSRPLFRWIRFFGGFAAPSFLLLVGITLALGLRRDLSRGAGGAAMRRRGLSRAAELFAYALFFRLVSQLFGGGRWWYLLRVDVLNCMGASMALAALVCPAATSRGVVLRAAAAWGLVIVLSPLAASFPWPTSLPLGALSAYIYGKRPLSVFPLLPWALFTFLGVAVGIVLTGTTPQTSGRAALPSAGTGDTGGGRGLAGAHRALVLLGGLGLLLWSGGLWVDRRWLTHRPYVWRWGPSPAHSLHRTGLVLLLLLLSYGVVWLLRPSPRHWLIRFGRASLAVYFVHIQLTYGWLAHGLKRRLPLGYGCAGAVVMVALMVPVVLLNERWRGQGMAARLGSWWRTRRRP